MRSRVAARDGAARAGWLDSLTQFLTVEAAGGVVLLVCTFVALVLANSPLQASYEALWQTTAGWSVGSTGMQHSLRHWINDGLMAVFLLVVGLEIKRELVVGELRDRSCGAGSHMAPAS